MSDVQSMAIQNRILEIRSGSHLYGTNTPKSDEDFAGIFMPSEEFIFGLQNVEECKAGVISKDEHGKNTKDAIDRTLHEFRRFCQLALKNNPNILELLFANEKNIVFKNEYGETLLSVAEMFPYKGTYTAFMGYAQAQKHKMFLKIEKLDDLESGYYTLCALEDKLVMAQVVDNIGKPFFRKGNNPHVHIGDLCFEAGVYVKKARAAIKERLDKFTSRKEFIHEFGFDVKFASNLIRLLREGIEILDTGKLQFPLTYSDEILSIKKGEWKIEDVIKHAEQLEDVCRKVFETSKLPDKPQFEKVNKFVIEQMKKFILKGINV